MGGILLRDIIAMGGASAVSLDGLGCLDDRRFDRAVAGIGHYGNCVAARRCYRVPQQRTHS